MKLNQISFLVCWSGILAATTAFVAPLPTNSVSRHACPSYKTTRYMSDNWASDMANGGGAGGIEQLEFKIFSDGRVEETVRGVKGNNCNKITDAINEKLGKVVDTAPTEEMYEQALVQDQTVYNTDEGSTSSW